MFLVMEVGIFLIYTLWVHCICMYLKEGEREWEVVEAFLLCQVWKWHTLALTQSVLAAGAGAVA